MLSKGVKLIGDVDDVLTLVLATVGLSLVHELLDESM